MRLDYLCTASYYEKIMNIVPFLFTNKYLVYYQSPGTPVHLITIAQINDSTMTDNIHHYYVYLHYSERQIT